MPAAVRMAGISDSASSSAPSPRASATVTVNGRGPGSTMQIRSAVVRAIARRRAWQRRAAGGVEQGRRDLGRRRRPELAHPRLVEEPRVRNGEPRRGRQCRDELLVLRGELGGLRVRQVEVAEHVVAHADGDAEESAHRRMPRREADRPRIVTDVGQTDRPRIVDERTEHPAALGEVADRGHRLRRHAHVDELLEAAARRDHAQRAVLGVDELHGGADDPLEYRRQFDRLDHGLRRLEERAQPTLRVHHLAGALDQLLERASSSDLG